MPSNGLGQLTDPEYNQERIGSPYESGYEEYRRLAKIVNIVGRKLRSRHTSHRSVNDPSCKEATPH